jgi:hypothetical protein
MLAIQAALSGLTGNPATGVFHTLSAGNMGQFGAPGTGVPADAVVGETLTVRPRHITPAAMHTTGPAIECRRTSPLPAGMTVPDPVAQAVKGTTDNQQPKERASR